MTRDVFLIVLAVSSAVDAAVAIAVLRWLVAQAPGAPRITTPTLLRIAGSVALLQVLKVPLLVWMGVDKWGVLHLVYLDLAVVLPLAAAAVLRLSRHAGATRPARGLAIAALIACPMLGGYMSFVEPVRLQVEEATVAMPAARTGPPITVGVLSDIQSERVGAWEHAAVDRLLAASPDVILVPGDLLQGWSDTIETQWEPIRTLLARLRAPGGVYFVSGNCESRLDVATLLAGLDITLLDNRVAPTVVRGRRLTIGGVEDDWRSGAARAVIRRLEGLPGDDDVRLLMAHRPDAVLNVSPDSRIDLVVAGHTHGGQVQLPWFGPPLTLSRVPRRVAAGGLHVLDGRRIYVSRGLGRERGQAPSIRLLCPPEITLLSLQ